MRIRRTAISLRIYSSISFNTINTDFEGEAAAGEGRPIVRQSEHLDAQSPHAMSSRPAGVASLNRETVDVAFLVIQHDLGLDHAADGVDGEDVVAVRVAI